MRTVLKTVAIVGALLLSSQASAEFVAADWQTVGDNKITIDSETGYRWLDFSETRGQSINQVYSQLDTTFKGWRAPTQAEVYTLLDNAFGGDGASNAEQGRWRSLFGYYVSAWGSLVSYAEYVDGGTTYMAGLASNGGVHYSFSRGTDQDRVYYGGESVFLVASEFDSVLLEEKAATNVSTGLGAGAVALAVTGFALGRRRAKSLNKTA